MCKRGNCVNRILVKWLLVLICIGSPLMVQGLPLQFVQEGLVETADGRPLQGLHRVDVNLYKEEGNRTTRVFQESHPEVTFINGYYAVIIGSEAPLMIDDFLGDGLLLGIRIDQGPELEPRTQIANVPSAMVAEYAKAVIGPIDPTQISVSGRLVIDEVKS